MPQSLAMMFTHIVFSTKNRTPLLGDKAIRDEMHAYLGGVCRNHGSPSLIVGEVDDHVHILCNLSRNIAVAALVQTLKKESSKWIKTKGEALRSFRWQAGYGRSL